MAARHFWTASVACLVLSSEFAISWAQEASSQATDGEVHASTDAEESRRAATCDCSSLSCPQPMSRCPTFWAPDPNRGGWLALMPLSQPAQPLRRRS